MRQSVRGLTSIPSTKIKGKGGALDLARSYNFVDDKHEIIYELRNMMDDAHVTLSYVSTKSGVRKETMRAWFNGKTKRPQAPTLNAVGKVFGRKLGWVTND